MNYLYAACEIGDRKGRVLLGALEQDSIVISEVHRFQHEPVQDKKSVYWNIPEIWQQILVGLRAIGGYQEAIQGVSCCSVGGDYLLFSTDGSLVAPTYHRSDPRTMEGLKKIQSKNPSPLFYEETGFQLGVENTLPQLLTESGRRLKGTLLMPIADAFNFLLSGVARAEKSIAASTQLYSLTTGTWSDRLLTSFHLPHELLPPVVEPGTELGPIHQGLSELSLEGTRVLAGCSHELSAAQLGLPIEPGESWAFLRPGSFAVLGTEVARPVLTAEARDLGFNQQPAYGGATCIYKHAPGLWLLEECQRQWAQTDHGLDCDLLTHLAGSSSPFESLIDPMDARFFGPGDMIEKIQSYCRDTNQPVPRKPGPIFRCILESLALLYRKTILELEQVTGKEFNKLFLLDGGANMLLNHFTANALQVPVTVVSRDAAAVGSVVCQALALRRLRSLDQAHEIVRKSARARPIMPHATLWNSAVARIDSLTAAQAAPAA